MPELSAVELNKSDCRFQFQKRSPQRAFITLILLVPIAVSHPSQVVLQNRTHAQSLELTVGDKVTHEKH